ncbi:MAG: ABC transporter permease [Gemmatimonadota bacterium]
MTALETRPSAPARLEPPLTDEVPGTDPVRETGREELILQPSGRWPTFGFGELWKARTLVRFLAWREIKIRYAQSILGAGWAILQPVLAMTIFTVIFGRLARMPSQGIPYPVFVLAALVPWTYFSSALVGAGNSLVGNPELVTKVYFPRLALPLAPIIAGLLDFCIASLLLTAVMIGYRIMPGPQIVLLLPSFLLLLVTLIGTGCWLSALNIQFRDVKHVTPFLVQLWLYASPVVYPVSLIPAARQPLYGINPLVSAIGGLRAALLGVEGPLPLTWLVSSVVASCILVSGILYFRRTERVFADVA